MHQSPSRPIALIFGQKGINNMSRPWSFTIPGIAADIQLDDSIDGVFEPSAAVENVLHQQALFAKLREARNATGRSLEDAATLLGISTELLQQVEAGSQDMTFSELRQFAYAADAVITYHVQHRAAEAQEASPDWRASMQWFDSVWVPSESSSPSRKGLLDAIRR
jgi:transcriptional regulator with XRE-family HTH domain